MALILFSKCIKRHFCVQIQIYCYHFQDGVNYITLLDDHRVSSHKLFVNGACVIGFTGQCSFIQNIEGNGTKHTTEATCADPESFDHSTFDNVLFCIQLMGESKIPLKSGPSSARQRSVIYMAFRWRGNDGQN